MLIMTTQHFRKTTSKDSVKFHKTQWPNAKTYDIQFDTIFIVSSKTPNLLKLVKKQFFCENPRLIVYIYIVHGQQQ